jgi:hypothetical protein
MGMAGDLLEDSALPKSLSGKDLLADLPSPRFFPAGGWLADAVPGWLLPTSGLSAEGAVPVPWPGPLPGSDGPLGDVRPASFPAGANPLGAPSAGSLPVSAPRDGTETFAGPPLWLADGPPIPWLPDTCASATGCGMLAPAPKPPAPDNRGPTWPAKGTAAIAPASRKKTMITRFTSQYPYTRCVFSVDRSCLRVLADAGWSGPAAASLDGAGRRQPVGPSMVRT